MSNPNRPNSSQLALNALDDVSLQKVVERAKRLAKLEAKLLAALPVVLRPHCRLGNVTAGTVVFMVDAPVWKSKLRLHQELVLNAAIAAGLSPNSLTIKVVPDLFAAPASKAGTPLSDSVRDSLRTTASSVADPDLRDQLMKLANSMPGGRVK
jgi:hypothetical protein